jgi:LacI family transcriptional regulator
MSVTLNNIATELGISHMTVSRALKGDPAVAEKTRNRVLDQALKMGYRPNVSARSMRSGQFGTLGLLAGSIRSYLPGSLMRGIREGCEKLDLHLQIDSITQEQADDPTFLPRFLQYACVDGLMVSYTGHKDALANHIDQHRLPAVWINDQRSHNAVYPDEIQAGQIMAQTLLDHGHRRIGFAALQLTGHFSTQVRLDGINAQLTQAGLPDAMLLDETISADSGIDRSCVPMLLRLLQRSDRPTALICRGLAEATCAYAAAMQLGLNVPADLSIVAFNDKVILDVCALPIDTLLIPFHALGEAVAVMTHELTQQPTHSIPSQVIAYGDIQQSGSIAAPASH